MVGGTTSEQGSRTTPKRACAAKGATATAFMSFKKAPRGIHTAKPESPGISPDLSPPESC